MFAAVNDSQTATIMHLRKWLRILINRSLVLGTIDRPSLHDLVLDFAVSQHSSDELRKNHRRVVEAFRASRPLNAHGRPCYDRMRRDDLKSEYVCNEIAHHLEKGWELEAQSDEFAVTDELATTGWLADVPQDDMVVSAAQVLGLQRLSALADRAQSAGDWWLRARYLALMCAVKARSDGSGAVGELPEQVLEAISRFLGTGSRQVSAQTLDDVYEVQLAALHALALTMNMVAIDAHAEEISHVLTTRAAVRDPASAVWVSAIKSAKILMAGNAEQVGQMVLDLLMRLRSSAQTDPDPTMRIQCSIMCYCYSFLIDTVLLVDNQFDWATFFGEGGSDILEASRSFNYDTMHAYLTQKFIGDYFMGHGAAVAPIILHFGDLDGALEHMERSLVCIRRAMEEPNQNVEAWGLVRGITGYSQVAYVAELPKDCCDAIASVLAEYGMTWSGADAKADAVAHPAIRKRGDTTLNSHAVYTAEMLGWMGKCAYVLMSSKPDVSSTEVLDSLPSVEEAVGLCMTFDHQSFANGLVSYNNLFVFLACACEKLELHERVLVYTAAGLETDPTKAGTELPSNRVLLQSLAGRAYVALGRTAEAATAFEAAAEEGHRTGFWLLEAYALRDLQLSVLEPLGHGGHGRRRLGAALRQLKGPASALTAVLKGLNAAELMALPDPDPGYKVVLVEDDEDGELRAQLSAMKLSALRKRAKAGGVDEDAMERAADGDDERATLVELIVSQRSVGQALEDRRLKQLRAELGSLKLSALRKKAQAAGIDEAAMEDAADSGNEREDIIELLVAAKVVEPAAAADRPHHGTKEPQRQKKPTTKQGILPGTKHAMLSYQWDDQERVVAARQTLTRLGVPC
eukprot:COSAG04_NODE_2718_length_3687_cov_4.212375_1_plen_857_part_10